MPDPTAPAPGAATRRTPPERGAAGVPEPGERFDLVVRSRRAVTPDGERPAAVAVRGGRIAAVAGYRYPLHAAEDVDLGDVALLPGLVDTHVHVNEPGRTEWEGFATATRAAAAGGVTTLLDMPLNSIPPTVDGAALAAKRAAAAGRVAVDVGFWGGAVPTNLGRLGELHEAGVFGVKCFVAPSGVDEFPPLDWPQVARAAEETAALGGLLIVHAEEPTELSDPPPGRGYAGFLASRPPRAETAAVARLAGIARATGARIHIVHVSGAGALPVLAEARAAGVPLTAETCPHYLALAAEDIPDGATEAKCCPPIRGADHRDALWAALSAGTLDCVVSDHSPCPPARKHTDTGDFAAAWGGIAGIQLALPVVWTAARTRGNTLTDVTRWMSTAPARLVGLAPGPSGPPGPPGPPGPVKGSIAVGADADLVAFAADEEFTVDPAALRQRHPLTPYTGARLTGVVRRTWLRGAPTGPGTGRLLTRTDTPS
jgi:allantoinase